jgi:hypothetical protein
MNDILNKLWKVPPQAKQLNNIVGTKCIINYASEKRLKTLLIKSLVEEIESE